MKARSSDRRAQLIRLIQVARRELQLPDDLYLQIKRSTTGKDSAADMDIRQLESMLDHLKKAGFKIRAVGKSATRKSRPLASEPDHKKIRAIWLMLADMGVVRDPSERALAAYCKRLTGVEALQRIDGQQSYKLIEALKKWALRFLPGRVVQLDRQIDWESIQEPDRTDLRLLVAHALERGTYDPIQAAYEALCARQSGGDHGRQK